MAWLVIFEDRRYTLPIREEPETRRVSQVISTPAAWLRERKPVEELHNSPRPLRIETVPLLFVELGNYSDNEAAEAFSHWHDKWLD